MTVPDIPPEIKRRGPPLWLTAERTGMDRMAISRLENGKNANPTVSTLVRYASALGRSLAWGLVGPTADMLGGDPGRPR
jgi:transcriptional regulator with XRE-family HTH domain